MLQLHMMLYQLVIPLLLLFVPWVIVRHMFVTTASRRLSYNQAAPYLVSAAVLWFIACALPEFALFGGATTTFALHTIGGVIAAILFWYVARAYKLKFTAWWQEPVFLYGFVCGGGVLNELFEFFLHQTGFLADKGVDTWWDLTANTLGAALAFATVLVLRHLRTPG